MTIFTTSTASPDSNTPPTLHHNTTSNPLYHQSRSGNNAAVHEPKIEPYTLFSYTVSDYDTFKMGLEQYDCEGLQIEKIFWRQNDRNAVSILAKCLSPCIGTGGGVARGVNIQTSLAMEDYNNEQEGEEQQSRSRVDNNGVGQPYISGITSRMNGMGISYNNNNNNTNSHTDQDFESSSSAAFRVVDAVLTHPQFKEAVQLYGILDDIRISYWYQILRLPKHHRRQEQQQQSNNGGVIDSSQGDSHSLSAFIKLRVSDYPLLLHLLLSTSISSSGHSNPEEGGEGFMMQGGGAGIQTTSTAGDATHNQTILVEEFGMYLFIILKNAEYNSEVVAMEQQPEDDDEAPEEGGQQLNTPQQRRFPSSTYLCMFQVFDIAKARNFKDSDFYRDLVRRCLDPMPHDEGEQFQMEDLQFFYSDIV
eukprot:Nk52_evm16s2391 gene=Nk52_evmTU16s2391